ncbi:MAG: PilZ domain-containing protein [Planctomycetes bacterium]|nr:PilZ domain-containing protein [Planctomycetota bacterium]
MTPFDRDRRVHARTPVTHPCKVYEPRSRRYVAGRTCDIAAGGVLVRLDRRMPLEPGDELLVGVAWRREALLRQERMITGRVVRALSLTTGGTTVALRFDDATAELPMAA